MRHLSGFAAVLGAALASPACAQDMVRTEAGEVLLMVSSEGSAEALPDTMTITLGVSATGSTAEEALESSAQALERVLAAIEAERQGIRNIATEDFGVQPVFPEDYDEEDDVRILGYSAALELEIEFEDFESAGTLIPALFEAGANNVRGPYWSIEDPLSVQRLEQEAMRSAIRFAREEAEVIAEASGLRIARILRISDANPGRNRYVNSERGRIVVTGSRVRAIPIIPQPVEVDQDIYIEFALVPAE